MYRLLIIVGFTLTIQPLLSQDYIPSIAEDSLYRLFEQYQVMQTGPQRGELNIAIFTYMQENLVLPETFEYRFDSLRKRAGILESGDGLFRIFTWNIPISAWEHELHGLIQVYDKESNTCAVHILHNGIEEIPDLIHSVTGPGMWPGVLYYDVLRKKKGKQVYYTLMGFSFHDRWSDKKIIEALHFDENMNPLFGKPVFNTPEGIQHRVVFEYSGDVAMNLRYNPDLKMIVYDHLEPIEPELAAHPRFYAPDFSYDGYKFRKGMWEFRSDLDVRNR
ncbi:MAG TPA: hypothetical protein ENI20_17085 [Bacteroides sp.]|nr:hypothetical protein [Bacteroides sp.]